MPNDDSKIPKWVTDTPSEATYELEMYCGEAQQTISMSREEFIALKDHLAELRGYGAPKSAE